MPQVKDIAFQLNDTWDIEADCRDASNNLLDIATAEWRVATESERLLLATIDDGISVTGLGLLSIQIPMNMQAGINAGLYDHELWVVDSGGFASVQFYGKINVVQSLKRKFP
jgi:hypothetical protein